MYFCLLQNSCSTTSVTWKRVRGRLEEVLVFRKNIRAGKLVHSNCDPEQYFLTTSKKSCTKKVFRKTFFVHDFFDVVRKYCSGSQFECTSLPARIFFRKTKTSSNLPRTLFHVTEVVLHEFCSKQKYIMCVRYSIAILRETATL